METLFGREVTTVSEKAFTCNVCKGSHKCGAVLEFFMGLKVCHNCFPKVESEIASRFLSEIMPWYREMTREHRSAFDKESEVETVVSDR